MINRFEFEELKNEIEQLNDTLKSIKEEIKAHSSNVDSTSTFVVWVLFLNIIILIKLFLS